MVSGRGRASSRSRVVTLERWLLRRFRSPRVRCSAGAVAFAFVCVAVALSTPGKSAWLPSCLFHRLTGLHCPGCGNTRALHALMHGDIAGAFANNLLLVPALMLLGVLLVRPRLAFNRWICLVVAVAVTVFFVARNLPWMPFAALAP